MNFWEKVTGSDITSAMQSYAERMYGLSEDYAAVWDEIVRCLYAYTDFTGRNILPVLDGLADWLEAAAVDGKSVREVLGEDIESFWSALASGEGLKTGRDRWREQLNRSVKKRLGGSL